MSDELKPIDEGEVIKMIDNLTITPPSGCRDISVCSQVKKWMRDGIAKAISKHFGKPSMDIAEILEVYEEITRVKTFVRSSEVRANALWRDMWNAIKTVAERYKENSNAKKA